MTKRERELRHLLQHIADQAQGKVADKRHILGQVISGPRSKKLTAPSSTLSHPGLRATTAAAGTWLHSQDGVYAPNQHLPNNEAIAL